MTDVDRVAELMELRDAGPAAGERATATRFGLFGGNILVRAVSAALTVEVAGILRRGEWIPSPHWPTPGALQLGDRVTLRVEPDDALRWAAYLMELARWAASHDPDTLGGFSIAPFASVDAGLHQLWAIASARISLPASIRVEARHDLLGIQLAQVALQYGADTLCGPTTDGRKLPLAGVPRPNETSLEALAALVSQAGLEPRIADEIAPIPVGGDMTQAMSTDDPIE